jgi:hypothetical protein
MGWSLCAFSSDILLPFKVSQTLTFPLKLYDEKKSFPVLEKATEVAPVSDSKVANSPAYLISNNLQVLSSDPVPKAWSLGKNLKWKLESHQNLVSLKIENLTGQH